MGDVSKLFLFQDAFFFLIYNSFAVRDYCTSIGFDRWHFKEKFDFNHPLNGDEVKRYFENESRSKNITFLFNEKPIPFNFEVKIFRTDEYERRLYAKWSARRLLNPGSESDESDVDTANTMNEKQILNA